MTNAPTTFQSCINMVFREHMRKYVLVFFYDILVYGKNRKEHIQHLELVLTIIANQYLYEKLSNVSVVRNIAASTDRSCSFGLNAANS